MDWESELGRMAVGMETVFLQEVTVVCDLQISCDWENGCFWLQYAAYV